LPEFTTAREVISFGKKFSKEELVRSMRFSVAAEYEAIQIYELILEATDNTHVKAVVQDIINEERLHAWQFLDLLSELVPEEKAINESGAKENKERK